MSALVDALVIVAIAALVIVRQFRASRVDTDRRWGLLPAVLAVMALREPHLLDAHHVPASAVILGAELLVVLATGVGWAWTTRIGVEPDGAVWSRSTRSSVGVWILGPGLRAGLFALGVLFGVHQDSSALLPALAGTLLVRSGILIWRARRLDRSPVPGPAYGEQTVRTTWKERV